MNIGDKVRLLRSKEEGIITKILPNNILEVEIEEGFGIPLARSEVVRISPEEENRFKPKTTSFVKFGENIVAANPNHEEPKLLAQKGLFLGFVPINDNLLVVQFINNTDFDLPFAFGVEQTFSYKGITAGVISPKSYMRIHEVELKNFDSWGNFVVEMLFFSTAIYQPKPPLIKKIKFKAKNFFNHKKELPVLLKQGFLFQLDEQATHTTGAVELIEVAENQPVIQKTATAKLTENPSKEEKTITPIDAQKLKEEMMEKKEYLPPKIQLPIKAPQYETDLHIEALTKDFDKMNSAEMLELQIRTFEKKLEDAIAVGMSEIIFIHGVGNGRLKTEIHLRLSQQKNIKYFEDARKEKFGYGATLVKIK